MLRKIEHYLDFISEARGYIQLTKGKELYEKEVKQTGERRK